MKKKMIVILDIYHNVTPYKMFVEAARRLAGMGYDALLLESNSPAFDEWVLYWRKFPRVKAAAQNSLLTLISLIRDTRRMKYVPIDAADRLLSQQEIAAGFSAKDKTEVSEAGAIQLLKFLAKYKADSVTREQQISC